MVSQLFNGVSNISGVPAVCGVPTSHCCLHLLHGGSPHPISTTASQIANQKGEGKENSPTLKIIFLDPLRPGALYIQAMLGSGYFSKTQNIPCISAGMSIGRVLKSNDGGFLEEKQMGCDGSFLVAQPHSLSRWC